MMAKLIAPIAMAVMLGALPAGASHRHHEQRGDHVLALAQRLDRAANELYREAAASRHRRSWHQWRALHTLRSFGARAGSFEQAVANRGPGHRSIQGEFARLERSYRAACAAGESLHRSRRLADEYQAVERLMRQLDARLVASRAPGRRHTAEAPRLQRRPRLASGYYR